MYSILTSQSQNVKGIPSHCENYNIPASDSSIASSLSSYESWGKERDIDSGLLDLNISDVWSPLPEGLPHDQALECISPLLHAMGETITPHMRQFATDNFKKLWNRYRPGGFTIQGIIPTSGEDSDYPRLRLNQPFRYFHNGKLKQEKYRSPKGSVPQDFYARVPLHIAKTIASRYGIEYDRTEGDYGGFWGWVKENRIPVLIVEGEGDALATLSRGYVAVGIPGHHMGFKSRTKSFRRELEWLLENKPEVTIAFDQDVKPETRKGVERSRRKVFWALKDLGITATVATWEPSQGKGAGDLPAEVLDFAVANSIAPFKFDEGESVRKDILKPFGERPRITITGGQALAEFLCPSAVCPTLLMRLALDSPDVLGCLLMLKMDLSVLVNAPTGAGKTKALIPVTRNHTALPTVPSRSLKASLDNLLGQNSVVINSLYKLPEASVDYLICDEVDQVHHALTLGGHLQQRDANISAYQRFVTTLTTIAQSATARFDDIELLENISGKYFQLIDFVSDHGHAKPLVEVHHGDSKIKGSATASKGAVIERIRAELINGNRVLFAFDEKIPDLIVRAKHWGLTDENILLINAETKQNDPRVQHFVESPDPGTWVQNHPEILLICYNSAIPSGFSLQGDGLFSLVAGIFTGKTVAPALVNQMIYRYRGNVPIVISVPFKSHFKCQTGTSHRTAQGVGKDRKLDAKRLNRLDRERAIEISTGRGFNFRDDDFTRYQESTEIRLDREYRHFAVATIAYLEKDNFPVEVIQHETKGELEDFRDELNAIKARPIVESRAISESEYQTLTHTPELSKLALAQIDAYELRKFYGLGNESALTVEMVIAEGFGKGRKQFQNLLRLTVEGKSLQDDLARADLLGPDCSSFDMTNHAATLKIWDALKIPEILTHVISNGYSQNDDFLRNWWNTTLFPYVQSSHQSPALFGFKVPHFRPGDYGQLPWFVGMILRKLGFRTQSQRVRTGHGDDRLRVYQVTEESLNDVRTRILRTLELEGFQFRATPLTNIFCKGVARPAPTSTMEQYLEALRREDLPEIQRLIAILDSEGEEF